MADEINGNTRNQVWSASYAGVEVFQQLYNGTAVMRRRKDSYVNVTQILKCAQYDKPHRTRFLEREIHTGIHEKVQGGYGKYQGTWVPLERAISLARQLNVYDALRHVLDGVRLVRLLPSSQARSPPS
ncbi:apses-domain-containing protein [Martensiomyces pterosporus]|nr:apses-domain-containing protein [Martensiomyces pterosporus]